MHYWETHVYIVNKVETDINKTKSIREISWSEESELRADLYQQFRQELDRARNLVKWIEQGNENTQSN